MSSPKLLIFDLDGTLIDSRRDLVECVNATLIHCNLQPLDEDRIASFIGDGVAALVDRSLQASPGSASAKHQEALSFFLAHYREHLLDHTHLYPGVIEALSALLALPKPPIMAVLTNKPVSPSRRICDALGLTPFLFANYGGNSFPSKKPDPQGLRALWREAEIARAERLQPHEVVLVGDSEVDVRTARNAGAKSWGCTWGFATAKMLAESPDALAQVPEDWLTLAQASSPALI